MYILWFLDAKLNDRRYLDRTLNESLPHEHLSDIHDYIEFDQFSFTINYFNLNLFSNAMFEKCLESKDSLNIYTSLKVLFSLKAKFKKNPSSPLSINRSSRLKRLNQIRDVIFDNRYLDRSSPRSVVQRLKKRKILFIKPSFLESFDRNRSSIITRFPAKARSVTIERRNKLA